MPTAEIEVFLNGRYLKTITRPLHGEGVRQEIVYKGKRYHVVRGNRIELGTGAETVANSPSVGSSIGARADVPTPEQWTNDQRAIIAAPLDFRVIVEAPPGTGKTAVGCARIAHLLQQGVAPSAIWMISFTRTAVQEIRNRIAQLSECMDGAYAVRIATIDSHAWQLRQGFEGGHGAAFSSFAQGIIDAVAMLDDPSQELLEELAAVEHLVIDEAQDVVGIRREMMCRLISYLRVGAGITVFTDSAQAIYGFTEDDGPVAGDEPLPQTLLADRALAFETRELKEVIRTSSPGLRRIFVNTRRLVLHAAADSMQRVLKDVRENADGAVDMDVRRNSIAGRDDVLVIYRRRSEVLMSAGYLAGEGAPFRVRMSGYPTRIAPWVGAVFFDWTSPILPEAEFRLRFGRCLQTHWRAPDVDGAWEGLVRHAGRTSKTIDVRRLREVLSRTQPPLDFATPELGDSGPILGTIHASKGREAEEVHLMLSDLEEDDLTGADEVRVVFVGATRARRVLKLGRAGGKFSSKTPSGRRFRCLRGGRKACIEIGRANDIDEVTPASKALFEDADAASAGQALIRSLGGAPLKGTLRRRQTGGQYEWLLFPADEDVAIARMTDGFNTDLWNVVNQTAAKRNNERMRPPSKLNNVFILCSRTIVRPDGHHDLALLHEPWASSGFWLAPVIFAYPTGFFSDG